MPKSANNRHGIALFGHFGAGNFGNESTLQAMLSNLRRLRPDTEVTCVCTAPDIVAAEYDIAAVPMIGVVVRPWTIQNPIARLLRKLLVGIPSELYRWFKGIMTLRDKEALIVVGTGLLTDSFSVTGWGPYSTFKWSVIAKLCRCQLCFVSVGAGPLHRTASRLLVKSALSLADFRSYRDESTEQYVKEIGVRTQDHRVYPDLAFSLPMALLPRGRELNGRRLVVGLGLMVFAGMYGIEKTTSEHYAAYMETLVTFVRWLLDREYDVRLLIGDRMDVPVTREFKSLLRDRLAAQEEERITAEPITSAKDLLSQLAATDFVVGTRFHNIVLALLLNKPSIAISFHHKCSSLMAQMGLSEFCQDIQRLSADGLIERFRRLEHHSASLRRSIGDKVAMSSEALDEQYRLIFNDIYSDSRLSKQGISARMLHYGTSDRKIL